MANIKITIGAEIKHPTSLQGLSYDEAVNFLDMTEQQHLLGAGNNCTRESEDILYLSFADGVVKHYVILN